jgi:hypothetical protein
MNCTELPAAMRWSRCASAEVEALQPFSNGSYAWVDCGVNLQSTWDLSQAESRRSPAQIPANHKMFNRRLLEPVNFRCPSTYP